MSQKIRPFFLSFFYLCSFPCYPSLAFPLQMSIYQPLEYIDFFFPQISESSTCLIEATEHKSKMSCFYLICQAALAFVRIFFMKPICSFFFPYGSIIHESLGNLFLAKAVVAFACFYVLVPVVLLVYLALISFYCLFISKPCFSSNSCFVFFCVSVAGTSGTPTSTTPTSSTPAIGTPTSTSTTPPSTTTTPTTFSPPTTGTTPTGTGGVLGGLGPSGTTSSIDGSDGGVLPGAEVASLLSTLLLSALFLLRI